MISAYFFRASEGLIAMLYFASKNIGMSISSLPTTAHSEGCKPASWATFRNSSAFLLASAGGAVSFPVNLPSTTSAEWL